MGYIFHFSDGILSCIVMNRYSCSLLVQLIVYYEYDVWKNVAYPCSNYTHMYSGVIARSDGQSWWYKGCRLLCACDGSVCSSSLQYPLLSALNLRRQ